LESETEYHRYRSGKDLETERLELQTKSFRDSIQKQISLLGINKDTKVLDAGCGTGSFARTIAPLVSTTQLRAIDIEPIFVEEAIRLSGINGIPNIKFEVGDIQSLGFPDKTFDLSYAGFVFPHLANPTKAISELIRVTRKGGKIASVDEGDLFTYPPASLDKFFELFEKMARWRKATQSPNMHTADNAGKELFRQFSSSGLSNVTVYPIPTYASSSENPSMLNDLTAVVRQMIDIYKDEIIASGFMNEGEYVEGLNELGEWLVRPNSFWMVLTIMTVGTVTD
jgi:ubiquinone/menaquinone biosynthesis C-methylase UbiE